MGLGCRKYHLAAKFQIINLSNGTFCLFSKDMMARVYCTAIAGIALFNPQQPHFPTHHSSTAIKVNEYLIIRGMMSHPFPFMITGKIAHVIQHCTSILFYQGKKILQRHQIIRKRGVSVSLYSLDETFPCALDTALVPTVLKNIDK